ncbi:XdhC family protein [Allopusillimonas ginsengisoli]|uniref:XdhC family protein n=1 Tax=Allopusillimonas ginsengisoli TaxID=453575 RepID=UPI0039C2812E
MNSTDLSVLTRCIEWLESGRRAALVTVVRTWGSAPRPEGAWLAIRDDGQIVGSVSGGCIEDDLIHRVRHDGLLAHETPQLAVYGVGKDDAARFGLPCGGTLELVIESHPDLTALRSLLLRIQAKRITVRELTMQSGTCTLHDADRSAKLHFDGISMRSVYGPRWRLVLIGAGELSQCVAQIAMGADYDVVIIDPREEFLDGFSIPGVRLIKGMPDDILLELDIDAHSAIVALTHDPKLDDMALLEALKSAAFYIGALGSRRNTKTRKERLLEFDLSAAEINRLQGPTGLYLGARTPAEIAVAILAELTCAKYHVPILQKREILAVELNKRHALLEVDVGEDAISGV